MIMYHRPVEQVMKLKKKERLCRPEIYFYRLIYGFIDCFNTCESVKHILFKLISHDLLFAAPSTLYKYIIRNSQNFG